MMAAASIAERLGIRVIRHPDWGSTRGKWSGRDEIHLGSNPDDYTFLHEIGHAIVGHACCREHAEFMAHGAALALAKIFGIQADSKDIYRYAGRSVCPAAEENGTLTVIAGVPGSPQDARQPS